MKKYSRMLDKWLNGCVLTGCLVVVLNTLISFSYPGAAAAGGAGGRQDLISKHAEKSGVRERWEIEVGPGERREFIFTNREATHFSGESAGPNSRSYHGLFCSMHEYLDSWEFSVGGVPVGAGDISTSLVYPHLITRIYQNAGVTEQILLPDGENGLMVCFAGNTGGRFRLRPWVDMRFIWEVPRPEYRLFWEKSNNTLLISRADNSFPSNIPRWIAITSNVPMEFSFGRKEQKRRYPKDAARNAMGETFPFSPGYFLIGEGERGRKLEFVFALGGSEEEAVEQARKLSGRFDDKRKEKLARIEDLLEGVGNPFADRRYQKAFRWAFASMDNLIMNQRGRGIYAGFHWFPNFWGRDTFISLPGACLVTGRFDTAGEIILSFMEYQKTGRDDPQLGRFPNIVNPDNLQYSGVDGTWWLVRAAWKYVIRSGDWDMLVRGFPRIRLAIEGALEKAVDQGGFLIHQPWETWMDAGGSSNPYSPRGDRAVEVQALFHYVLLAGSSWALTLTDNYSESDIGENIDLSREQLLNMAERWQKRAALLGENFRSEFWNEKQGYLFDHLNPDGTPDGQIRPNALLAMWVSLDERSDLKGEGERLYTPPGEWTPLITAEMGDQIVSTALETVILPHGVTSLSPEDPGFHPRHLDLDRYFYDEAYHNGDVWEWLTGPAISCLVATGRMDRARELYRPLVDEILNQACVGSLREIQDGRHTPGREEFGGATSQAWSLAEFIRVSLTGLNRRR